MIETAEYQKRRESLQKQLKGAVAVVYAGEHAAPAVGKWRGDANFIYLTGIDNEPGAALLFDPTNENPNRRITLFLRPSNIEMERWDGYRDQIGSALKDRYGFKGFGSIMRTTSLPAMLTGALRRAKQAACLHPFAVYPANVSPDLNAFQQVSQRIPGVKIEDRTQDLVIMRAIKSPAEIALLERAADITVAAYREAIKYIKPGLNESQVQLALETIYKQQGGDIGYGTIVGSGINGTVLHYIANDQPLKDGDLLVIDSAASFGGYVSDITRTFPVSGKFTPDQRELYEVVLKAELAAIKAARPGATFYEVDSAARNVIEKAGLGDAFIHAIGHPLGLVVHDVVPDHPIKPNMVITIEPGIYLPDRKIGIRIEDDLVITKTGNRNITSGVPKTVKEIEAAMGR
ncbi:MAG: aminopeptidase P family protein [Burkholderiales bacterium]|nr:aminopeptidase P family protein [Phycisphaerae bacterium]